MIEEVLWFLREPTGSSEQNNDLEAIGVSVTRYIGILIGNEVLALHKY